MIIPVLDISNEVGHVKSVCSFFIPFAQTPALRSPAVSFGGRCAAILGLFFLSNLRDSVRVTSSTRCCPPDISPITCDHDDFFELPAMGRRVAYSLDPVTMLQDHCRDQASPHGHYRFPAALFLDGRTLRNRSGHAS